MYPAWGHSASPYLDEHLQYNSGEEGAEEVDPARTGGMMSHLSVPASLEHEPTVMNQYLLQDGTQKIFDKERLLSYDIIVPQQKGKVVKEQHERSPQQSSPSHFK